jgi:non-canonical (house-cleaning) NTP pyrophosphatase
VEVAACAIFDGSQVHLGLSPAFEWPTKVTDSILNKGLDGSQAMKEAGLTPHEKIGEKEGVIGLLTKGRMNRTEYNKLAIMMALTHLENPEHF